MTAMMAIIGHDCHCCQGRREQQPRQPRQPRQSVMAKMTAVPAMTDIAAKRVASDSHDNLGSHDG
eukprot:3933391-Alexandrium_andersonii.AAC.1